LTSVERARITLGIDAKLERGERLTRADRLHMWAELVLEMRAKVAPLLAAGKAAEAVDQISMQFASHFVAAADRADALEDRLDKLEATKAVKPRLRVHAGRRERDADAA
jgi:hypothetical protein